MATILYILGLFGTPNEPLFKTIKDSINGYDFQSIELYADKNFGSHSFDKELTRISKTAHDINPELIIAHSLGGYVSLQLSQAFPLILLDPSLSISDIILPNLKEVDSKFFYDDGTNSVELSLEFVESLKNAKSIQDATKEVRSREIDILGAGHGGYKVAEQYAGYLPQAHYLFLSEADHNFSNKSDIDQIVQIIKKRLGIIPSRD